MNVSTRSIDSSMYSMPGASVSEYAGDETNQYRLMVVDDNQVSLDILCRHLKKFGYSTLPVNNPFEAQAKIRNQDIDLILLDITMPGMNGYELCCWLKKEEKLKEIPVIFLSSRVDTADKVEAFASGGVDYLTKPVQQDELRVRIEAHLMLSKAKVEIEQKNHELLEALNELRETQAQLVQSEKMASLGVLTAGIAHEINNPLNYIGASAKGLASAFDQVRSWLKLYQDVSSGQVTEDNEGKEQSKRESGVGVLIDDAGELVNNILTGVDHCGEIVSGLRSFSRLDNAEIRFVDIHNNIDAILTLLRHKYVQDIIIDKFYGDLPAIPCYPGKLNQVLINLLANAIDANQAVCKQDNKNRILISTDRVLRDGKEFVVISISDSGPGIDEEVMQHLFEPFYTTKDVGKGTGLGLAISLGVVKDHGGTIEVESTPGEGARFSVYLPLIDRDRFPGQSDV